MKRPPRTAPLAAALISAVAVAVLTLCTTLFLRSYRSAVIEAARTNSAQAVSQVVGTVGNYVSTMDSAVSIVMERLDDDTARRDAFLSAFLTARPEVAAITAYDADGQLLDCWAQEGRKPKDAILRNLSFDLTTARRLGHGYISTPHVESIFEGYYPWVVSVIRIVPEGDTARCWLSVDLSFKELAATISNVGIGQHGYCYLMDERGNMVYHPQQQLLYAGLKKEEAGRLACLGDGTYVEDTVIYSVQRVPGSPWRVVGVSYIDETVNESFWQMARIAVATAVLILFAALIVGWVLSRSLSRPLQQLETAMEQFEQDADHFAFQSVRGTREVQNLSDSFGHMVGRIQRLMTTVREEEVVLRKTELKALQAQINPHFLYNALDMVSWHALSKGEDSIADIVSSISNLMHYSISRPDSTASLSREIENIREFIRIYQMERPCDIQLIPDFSPEQADQIPIPKFTLQPLVENSILHNANLDHLTIRIQIHRQPDCTEISVTDDGIGADPEQLNAFLRYENTSLTVSSGFGIRNVNERLQLHFGNNSHLSYQKDSDGHLTASLFLMSAPLS